MQQYSVSISDDAENDIAELMAFYSELVDEASADRFFDEAIDIITSLGTLPHSHNVFSHNSEARMISMKNHKVSIIYVVNDEYFEVIAVRAFHQMQNPDEYQNSVHERIQKACHFDGRSDKKA